MNQTTSLDWWRPDALSVSAAADDAPVDSRAAHGRFAFGALLAFTFVLVFSPQSWLPALAPLRLAFVAALAAVVGHVVDRVRHRDAGTPALEFVIAGVLVAWAIGTVPLSLWPGGSVNQLLDLYLKSIVVFWLLGRVVNTPHRLYRLAWTLSVLSVPIALTGLRNYFAGDFIRNRIVGYTSGLAGNPNDLALTLDIILPLTLALLAGARSVWGRCAAALIAVISIGGIIVTFSRGGFLALGAILILSTVWMLRRRPMVALAGVVAIALAGPMVLPQGYIERVSTALDVDGDPTHSAQERLNDMNVALEIIQEHPIVGTGLGTDALAMNAVRGKQWRKVHDVYLEYGVDLGLVGLGLFVWLLGSSIRTAWRVERRARQLNRDAQFAALAGGVRISLIGFAVAALFYPVAYYFYFYYLAGLAVALRTISGSAKS
jgi:probable O-glycosylation ligase (exosortase A-associated)